MKSAGNPRPIAEPDSLPTSSPFIPLLTHRTARAMKKQYINAILDLIRYQADDMLAHSLECAETIYEKYCQEWQEEEPEPEPEPQQLRITIIE